MKTFGQWVWDNKDSHSGAARTQGIAEELGDTWPTSSTDLGPYAQRLMKLAGSVDAATWRRRYDDIFYHVGHAWQTYQAYRDGFRDAGGDTSTPKPDADTLLLVALGADSDVARIRLAHAHDDGVSAAFDRIRNAAEGWGFRATLLASVHPASLELHVAVSQSFTHAYRGGLVNGMDLEGPYDVAGGTDGAGDTLTGGQAAVAALESTVATFNHVRRGTGYVPAVVSKRNP